MDIFWKIAIPVITFILTGFLGWIAKQITAMKKADEQRDNELLKNVINQEIDTRIEPLRKDLEDLKDAIAVQSHREEELEAELVASYKFRLMHLCKMYIAQKYITQDQFDQLTEMYKLYAWLGGNGQAKKFYDKAMELPIVTEIPESQLFQQNDNR